MPETNQDTNTQPNWWINLNNLTNELDDKLLPRTNYTSEDPNIYKDVSKDKQGSIAGTDHNDEDGTTHSSFYNQTFTKNIGKTIGIGTLYDFNNRFKNLMRNTWNIDDNTSNKLLQGSTTSISTKNSNELDIGTIDEPTRTETYNDNEITNLLLLNIATTLNNIYKTLGEVETLGENGSPLMSMKKLLEFIRGSLRVDNDNNKYTNSITNIIDKQLNQPNSPNTVANFIQTTKNQVSNINTTITNATCTDVCGRTAIRTLIPIENTVSVKVTNTLLSVSVDNQPNVNALNPEIDNMAAYLWELRQCVTNVGSGNCIRSYISINGW